VTLKRGVAVRGDDLWQWHYDFVQGRGKRRDGVVTLLDEACRPAKVWKFKRGLPLRAIHFRRDGLTETVTDRRLYYSKRLS
jgi:hypothetical protein